MGLDKCIVAYIHHFNNIQSIFTALKVLCALPFHPHLRLAVTDLFIAIVLTLRKLIFIFSFLSVFMLKRCWFLSKAFLAFHQIIFLFALIALTDIKYFFFSWMLNHSFSFQIYHTWSWCNTQMDSFSNILFSVYVSMFIIQFGLYLFIFILSFSAFDVKTKLGSLENWILLL